MNDWNLSDWRLASAIEDDEPEKVESLLAPGSTIDLNQPADAAAFGPFGNALNHAVALCRFGIVRLLQQHGADPNIPDEYGRTPVHMICMHNHMNAAKAMLDQGGDMMMTTKVMAKTPTNCWSGGRTALELAVVFGTADDDAGFLRMLLVRGGNADYRNRVHGDSLLHLAAAYDRSEKMKVLLEFGANANAGDSRGFVPLQLACEKGSLSSVFILFKRMVGDTSISWDRNSK